MPYGYGSDYPHQGSNHGFPPYSHIFPNAQQTPYSRQRPPTGQPQQQQDQNGYLLSRTQYSTPYDQGQQQFYQSPSPPVQYQQSLYQSPQTPQTHFPATVQYSPDPLQHHQNTPHARQQESQRYQGYQGYQHQQQQQHAQQPHRPSAQYSQNLHPSPAGQSFSGSEWPASAYALNQSNAASAVNNSYLPPQNQQQRVPPQSRPSPGNPRFVTQSQNQVHPQPQQHHRPAQQQSPNFAASVNPQDLQRRTAQIEVPMQLQRHQSHENTMARSPKRRKSNEGHVVPVDDLHEVRPAPPRPTSSKVPQAAPVVTSPLTELASSQIHAPEPPAVHDYQAALLGLSDEYISAAYSMSADLSSPEVDEEQLDHYHSLLATGMGCLDSLLKHYRISDARKEARIRLRFASLLYEETSNDLEAEECLSKGITSCERSRLPDLKYAMHHLLARVWFKGGKTKAAMKAVEKLVVEVEKLRLTHWVYAFRFLRVSLGLQVETSPAETAMMLKHLSAILETASSYHGHAGVQIVAATLSAMVHLRSRSPDSVDLAQRELAAARTHQLSSEMDSLPQIKALLDFLDLACSLTEVRPEQAKIKMQVLQGSLDAATHGGSWGNEHSWSLSFGVSASTSPDIEADSYGIFKTLPGGESALNFTWLNETQVYVMGYLLSGLSMMHSNANHELKAEQFFSEGVKMSKQELPPAQQSMVSASAQASHQSLMLITIRLYLVFALCGRSAWDKAINGIVAIREYITKHGIIPEDTTVALLIYLEALCKHGVGDLDAALNLYRSPELSFDFGDDFKPNSGHVNPIKLLACLNGILIMRESSATAVAANRLLAQIEPHCIVSKNTNGNEYGNKAMEAAFYILKATSSTQTSADGMIIKTKQFLQSAVSGAKITLNNQLLCVVMNLLTDLFFTNIVGEQAEKSVKAARSLAKQSQNTLWTAVADRMFADTLVRCGKPAEAQQVRMEGQHTMLQLPASIRMAFQSRDVKMEGMNRP